MPKSNGRPKNRKRKYPKKPVVKTSEHKIDLASRLVVEALLDIRRLEREKYYPLGSYPHWW